MRITHCIYDGGAWFRIGCMVLSVVNKDKHRPLFSERNGYRKVWKLGRWGIEFLK